MHLDISPPQKYHPFLPSPLLNLQAVQALLFSKILPIYRFFMNQHVKSDFSVNPHNLQIFLSLIPIPSFKSN